MIVREDGTANQGQDGQVEGQVDPWRPDLVADSPYVEEPEGGLFAPDHKGNKVFLANFHARIVQQVVRHEAGKQVVRFRVLARHIDPKVGVREIVVDANEYPGLLWVYRLGPEFGIGPGRSIKSMLAYAIQHNSRLAQPDGIPTIEEHTALGWMRREGRWIYLHAGGAIGADGLGTEIRVDPWSRLENYRLPAPDPAIIREAIRSHLGIWDLGHGRSVGARQAAAIVATLPVRAVLGPCNFVPHLVGPTGNQKTSLARVALQHFADIRGREVTLTAQWTASAASLQGFAHACGDSLLAIDDLKFPKSLGTAEEIVQAQGNLQGRTRMNPDQTAQKSLAPRGAILSTGEIAIESESGLGRVLTSEISPGDIDLGILSRIQADADSGLLRAMIAVYIDRLAPRLDQVRAEYERLKERALAEIEAMPGAHPRHPVAIAQLIAGYEVFLAFALREGAIDELELARYSALAREALVSIGKSQADPLEDARTGRRFLDLIASELRSGRCHLLAIEEDMQPVHHEACGWRQEYRYHKDFGQELYWVVPSSSRPIGYVDDRGGMVYLIPSASKELANDLARRSGNSMAVSFNRVGQALMAEGLCVPDVETKGGEKKKRPDGRCRIRKTQDRYFSILIHHIINVDNSKEDDALLQADLDRARPLGPYGERFTEELVSSMAIA